MIVPVVNLNGNTRADLVEQAANINQALVAAIKLIREADLTHGRNFQTVKDAAALTRRAVADKAEHISSLEAMARDYGDLAYAISIQGFLATEEGFEPTPQP